MKAILVSQRVATVPSYGERRDCLDQNWCRFLHACDLIPVPVMNSGERLTELASAIQPSGILLTGGNNLAAYGGDAPERDQTEHALIVLGVTLGLPILGVCRGLQIITDHFRGQLVPVQGHTGSRHKVSGLINRTVNSYHGMAAQDAPSGFEVLARSEDGILEAMRHTAKPITAIMWHPERESPFCFEDVSLFQSVFCVDEK